MSQQQWNAVDDYIGGLFCPADAALDAVSQSITDAGMPQISVSPAQGKFLNLLAMSIGARKILEIGTLAGYSAIWLARALPADGKLITLEAESLHAQVAAANIARAGLEKLVEIRLGAALETLPMLAADGQGPFDLVFIDADKVNTPNYFEWAMKLTRRGSMIITDNVVRNGGVIDAASADKSIQGVRRFNTAVAAERRVSATVIQMVGAKGYDGMSIALVTGD